MMHSLSPRAIPLLLFKSFYELWHNAKQYLLLMAGSGVVVFQHPTLMMGLLLIIAVFFTYLTFKHYKNYAFSFEQNTLTLQCGVFNHLHVAIPKAQIERFEQTQNSLERLFDLRTLLFFTRSSSLPAMTLDYLTQEQSKRVLGTLAIDDAKVRQEENVKSRWLSAVFIGELYPYLTVGILVATPLFLALNILHQPPNPVDAKSAVTDTIEMGLLPLLATTLLAIPFYLFICLVGKGLTFAYLYGAAQFTIRSDLRIHGRVGLIKRRDWSIAIQDIQCLKVDTLPLLEKLGRFNVTLMPMGKSEVTMLIPGVDVKTLNHLLSLKSIPPLSRRRLIAPSMRSSVWALGMAFGVYVLPAYGLLIYLLPSRSLEVMTPSAHWVMVSILLMFTALWVWVSHKNNRICLVGDSVILGARQLRRTYYCFTRENIQSIVTRTPKSRLWPFKSIRYSLASKSITASYVLK